MLAGNKPAWGQPPANDRSRRLASIQLVGGQRRGSEGGPGPLSWNSAKGSSIYLEPKKRLIATHPDSKISLTHSKYSALAFSNRNTIPNSCLQNPCLFLRLPAYVAGPHANLAQPPNQSISLSCGLHTNMADRLLAERSSERTPRSAADRRTLPFCHFSSSSNRRTSRSRMHRPPSDLRSCTAPKHSRSRTRQPAAPTPPREFFSDSHCVPWFQSPLRFYANSRTAHLTRLSSTSPHRERHLNLEFRHPVHAHCQLIGIMAEISWRTKAAIGATTSWNCESIMNQTSKTIACIGGIVSDRKARVEGGARPGTSNPVSVTTSTGGVAANIARNLARLGCHVALFSILGADDSGATALRDLENSGVNSSAILRSRTHPTASYTAVLEPNGELFIGLADMDIFEELDSLWADRIAPTLARCPVWILDTNLPARTIERLLLTHKGNVSVLADPISIVKSERIRSSLAAVDVLFPNRKEAAVLSGFDVNTQGDVAKASSEIRKCGVGTVVVTLGGDGIYLDAGHGGKFLPVIPARKVLDVTGAGDALVAGFAYGMLAEGNHEPALYGLAAASLTVETEKSIAEDLQPERLLERMKSAPLQD